MSAMRGKIFGFSAMTVTSMLPSAKLRFVDSAMDVHAFWSPPTLQRVDLMWTRYHT